jgi:tetratricopeptide (TPR) repeat protein
VPAEHTERAAFLLAAQGDLGRSAELLERVTKYDRAKREGRLLLARIYAKQGRPEEALRLCEGVLDPPTLPAVELAAGLYAEAGRTADAAAVLARLDAAGIPAADAALLRARHAARWESRAAAAEQFRRAADAAPERADVWTALLVHAILAGDKAELARALDDPRSQGIDVIQHLRSIRDLCDAALADAGLRLLLRSSVEVPSSRAAATEALRLLARDWSDASKRADVARSVRLLAEANVGTLELQLLSADTTALAGDLRSGTDMARRTTLAFPNSALAARQWAELLFRGSRFDEALAAGRTWSDRAPAQERSADEFLGRVLLRLDRPKDAVAALDPHAAAALARPEENEVLLLVRAAALSRGGDRAATTELLTTLASRSERWRTLPLRVGPDWMATGDECQAWLETCAAVVPADDVKARLALAQAWGAAWQRFRTPGLLAGMKSVVTELTARPDASADAHFLAGTAAQLQGDPAAASASYAAALKVQPDHHSARNNLAMVLADGGKWEDAVKEAQTIVRAVPQSAEYLDTLAYAYRKGRKFDEAKARLAEAIHLQPLNPKWRVSLAETLAEAENVKELAEALSELRRMEESGAPFSPELRKRVERLRGIR